MTARSPSPTLRVLRYDTLGSTNDEAKRLAEAGAEEWTVVSAREQTGGRGRGGNAFVSPPGNLYLSVILRPARSASVAVQLGFAAALAVGEAVVSRLPPGRDLRYKWPNDVLVDGQKLSGILLESAAAQDGTLAWLVIGIGVNVASHPMGTAWPATSLEALGANPVVIEDLLRDTVTALQSETDRWLQEGFAPLRAAWLARAYGLGGTVGVRLPRERLSGRFVDLDRDGVLLLETAEGPRRIAAGEIFPAAA
ncbi:MAG TPA: biotin--[acetyl-CoA-carboxylase] ligase [Stellaceae bacterium]|nr:biotin--[acetyl-CoA-carboxylase] ligase [Stellaceae bacterium]